MLCSSCRRIKGRQKEKILKLFETVKSQITVKQAAEHYGFTLNRSSMICCPFHNDRTPSLKLNDTYFYCFGCHVTGDVIDFTARIYGLSNVQAARKLAADFSLIFDNSISPSTKPPISRKTQLEKERHALRVLESYLTLLKDWKSRYAPQHPDDLIDDRYSDACQMMDYAQFLCDIFTFSKFEERVKALEALEKEQIISGLERILERHRREDEDGNLSCFSEA